MAKIGEGGAKPPSKETTMEELLQGVFKDETDEVRGSTIGIDQMRSIDPQFDLEGKDKFDTKSRPNIGMDRTPEPEVDISKLRKESDTGLTVQMNQILMKRNLKNTGKI